MTCTSLAPFHPVVTQVKLTTHLYEVDRVGTESWGFSNMNQIASRRKLANADDTCSVTSNMIYFLFDIRGFRYLVCPE